MIFRSPFPDMAIPEVPLTDFILQHVPMAGGPLPTDENPDARS
jgi:hypothetical protein